MKLLSYGIALLAFAMPLPARYLVVFRLASPPLPVEAGQRFSLCAVNVGTMNADLTLEFLNVRTGAVVASRNVMLPPPGAGVMPDPCLDATAEQVSGAGGAPPLMAALVIIRHGLFSRAAAVTASVQVTDGNQRLAASIPLHLATMINGRNTPIERQ